MLQHSSFFFQNALNLMHISEMEETIEKMSFICEITAFQVVA